MTSLVLDGVSKSLGGVEVLHGVSLSVRSGTRAAIVFWGTSGWRRSIRARGRSALENHGLLTDRY